MSGAHDAGKGDASRVVNIRRYSDRNDEINWPHRRKREDEAARKRLTERLKGRKIEPCVESEWPPHLD